MFASREKNHARLIRVQPDVSHPLRRSPRLRLNLRPRPFLRQRARRRRRVHQMCAQHIIQRDIRHDVSLHDQQRRRRLVREPFARRQRARRVRPLVRRHHVDRRRLSQRARRFSPPSLDSLARDARVRVSRAHDGDFLAAMSPHRRDRAQRVVRERRHAALQVVSRRVAVAQERVSERRVALEREHDAVRAHRSRESRRGAAE